jgi:hypothetical protein
VEEFIHIVHVTANEWHRITCSFPHTYLRALCSLLKPNRSVPSARWNSLFSYFGWIFPKWAIVIFFAGHIHIKKMKWWQCLYSHLLGKRKQDNPEFEANPVEVRETITSRKKNELWHLQENEWYWRSCLARQVMLRHI